MLTVIVLFRVRFAYLFFKTHECSPMAIQNHGHVTNHLLATPNLRNVNKNMSVIRSVCLGAENNNFHLFYKYYMNKLSTDGTLTVNSASSSGRKPHQRKRPVATTSPRLRSAVAGIAARDCITGVNWLNTSIRSFFIPDRPSVAWCRPAGTNGIPKKVYSASRYFSQRRPVAIIFLGGPNLDYYYVYFLPISLRWNKVAYKQLPRKFISRRLLLVWPTAYYGGSIAMAGRHPFKRIP